LKNGAGTFNERLMKTSMIPLCFIVFLLKMSEDTRFYIESPLANYALDPILPLTFYIELVKNNITPLKIKLKQ